MLRVIDWLVEIHSALRAVIGSRPLSRCRSGGCTHPNSTSVTPCKPHSNDDGHPSDNRNYEKRKKPKDRGPVNKSGRHTDAACPAKEAQPRKSLLQIVSNGHATT